MDPAMAQNSTDDDDDDDNNKTIKRNLALTQGEAGMIDQPSGVG